MLSLLGHKMNKKPLQNDLFIFRDSQVVRRKIGWKNIPVTSIIIVSKWRKEWIGVCAFVCVCVCVYVYVREKERLRASIQITSHHWGSLRKPCLKITSSFNAHIGYNIARICYGDSVWHECVQQILKLMGFHILPVGVSKLLWRVTPCP